MLIDVKETDGEPWEVGAVAGHQAVEAANELSIALSMLAWSARGAWLSQQHHYTDTMPGPGEFEASPLGRKLIKTAEGLLELQAAIEAAAKSASIDPRKY